MADTNLPDGFGPTDPTAGDRAYTDEAACSFTFKEGPDEGRPLWVMIEQAPPGLPVLQAGDAFLGLTFKESVSFDEARRLAREMDRMLCGISYTKFIT